MTTLHAAHWRRLAEAHARRADSFTAAYRSRRATGERHAIDDFMFDYYGTRPARLRRWHPGVGVSLGPAAHGPAEHASWRWYRTDAEGRVSLDIDRFLADRGDAVRFIGDLLRSLAAKPAFTGCFGMHEWAMVYREREHRHPLPLRLGQAGTDAVVASTPVRCSHFDAFRFFTPEAVPLNRIQPTRATEVEFDQPGCLHVAMDCYTWAMKLGPAVPGDLLLDCFELAAEIRLLDMRASPYDVSGYGHEPVAVETPEGKAEYVVRQRDAARRAAGLRSRLIAVCEALA
jgi:hypothetical protein